VSVNAPSGFVASGVACGIKATGALDLALVATDDRQAVPCAGVFTTNRAAAAPVTVSREHLAASGGRSCAVVLSSGNANAATGAHGRADAERICELTGEALGVAPTEVLLCQTGLIGTALPMERIDAGIGALVSARAPSRQAGSTAARAIMTTDTVPKEVLVERAGYIVGGMAKGAAMVAPNMATMLAVLTTDATSAPDELARALSDAVGESFNKLTLDGSSSTNDTVLLLASGRSRIRPEQSELTGALEEACSALAGLMAGDAEGGTKLARIVVVGAPTRDEATRAARKVAESSLVKCSLNGEDPYWGRIVSELGSAGVNFDLNRVSVAYGGIPVCRGGVSAHHDTEAVRAHMSKQSIEITCDLGLGTATSSVVTCDLGHGYIDENRTTS
jgi:glutamate N-acetyltransferase / amino-acid N-acetyltransferase